MRKKQLTQAIAEVQAGSATIIDVRTPAEYAAGHALKALNFDVTRLQAGELPELSKSAKIYLYCRTGIRAGNALKILAEAGYTDVTNLRGFDDWVAAGGPHESTGR